MTPLRRRIGWLALPYTRMELPGWGRLLRALRVRGRKADPIWQGAGIRRLRGKWHGYTMILDLQNWSERISYFLGRYYDLPSQLVLRALLRPGDQMLDVGANIGMISLLAARLVGPEGSVEAFEPNPYCGERIREMLAENDIQHVRLHPVGLSDAEGEAVLSIPGTTSGSGTLSQIPSEPRRRQAPQYEVRIATGDGILGAAASHVVAIKIDVEGHEVSALRGLRRTLERCRPAVLAETVEAHLVRAGVSVSDLIETLEALGYTGYAPRSRRVGLGYRLELRPLRAEQPLDVTDTLWLHPDSDAVTRLAHLIAREAAPTRSG